VSDFEVIEHTADVGIRAFGATPAAAFENAARGMFSLITDLGQVNAAEEYQIEAAAEDRETLLVEWLNELLYLFESQDVLLGSFQISELTDTSLKATVRGEPVDHGRHTLDADIKAATYYMLKVVEDGDGWMAQVIFDV
jgi:SHS2 domain-containing protein